ncbi:MAG: guanylate kinase [Verrucomicrobia bacterium]|nr:guanylate kinase [Verrucomicrobiota bacterium]
MRQKGLVFVVSAPAGTGKTTLVQMLLKRYPGCVESISCTTRLPRPGEVKDEHYHFLSDEEFDAKIAAGDFLEWAQVFGYKYGTSKSFVEHELKRGHHVFLVIDTQGAKKIREKIDAILIFLSAPTKAELRRRLEERKTETAAIIEQRLAWAEKEVQEIPNYDYHIVNDDLNEAYQQIAAIVALEEKKHAP